MVILMPAVRVEISQFSYMSFMSPASYYFCVWLNGINS